MYVGSWTRRWELKSCHWDESTGYHRLPQCWCYWCHSANRCNVTLLASSVVRWNYKVDIVNVHQRVITNKPQVFPKKLCNKIQFLKYIMPTEISLVFRSFRSVSKTAFLNNQTTYRKIICLCFNHLDLFPRHPNIQSHWANIHLPLFCPRIDVNGNFHLLKCPKQRPANELIK